MPSTVYDIAKLDFATGALIWATTNTVGTWKVLLAYNTYTPNASGHSHVSDVASSEVTGTGYSPGVGGTGRVALAGLTAAGAAGDIVILNAQFPSWNTINVGTTPVRWAIVHCQTSANLDTASILACAIDITGVITNGGNLTIQWSGNGIMTIS